MREEEEERRHSVSSGLMSESGFCRPHVFDYQSTTSASASASTTKPACPEDLATWPVATASPAAAAPMRCTVNETAQNVARGGHGTPKAQPPAKAKPWGAGRTRHLCLCSGWSGLVRLKSNGVKK